MSCFKSQQVGTYIITCQYTYSNMGKLDHEPQICKHVITLNRCAAEFCPKGVRGCFMSEITHIFDILTMYRELCTMERHGAPWGIMGYHEIPWDMSDARLGLYKVCKFVSL